MPRIGIIIAILYVLFHVAQLVLQARAKRQQQERIRQEAERRRYQSGQMQTPSLPGPDDGTGTGDVVPQRTAMPTTVRTGQPQDDLAARRRAQLEELRTKRDNRRGGVLKPASQGPMTTSAQRSPTLPLPTVPSQVGMEERYRIREMERERREREEQRLRKQQEAAASRVREEAERQRREQEDVRLSIAKTQAAAAEIRATAADAQASMTATKAKRVEKSAASSAIAALMKSPREVRQALILKEILDQPVSMRRP